MIRRLAVLAALPILLSGCKSATTPSSSTTSKVTFTAQLSPANEVPAITNAEQFGSGNVTITMTTTKDANGNATAATVDFNATFSGFPAGTVLTAAHIHPGVAGTNGSVLVSTTIAAGEVTFPNGSGTLVKTGLTLPLDQAVTIASNPAAFYFNIHTALNPGGVARGQLKAS